MTVLCDTNIISELARPRPNPGVVRWAEGERRIAISVVTVEEISYGLTWRPNARVEAWIWSFVARRCDVLPVDQDVARRAGRLRGLLRSRGRPRTQTDMLIAATAESHHLTLVTRNARDFAGCNIPILDPFAP